MVILPASMAQCIRANGGRRPRRRKGLDKPIATQAQGETKADALASAAALAQRLANNPLLAAAMPPGTAAAVAAMSKIATSAAAGKVTKVVGKGAKRLAKALKFW